MPSQWVKLSSSTPTSGTNPKTMKIAQRGQRQPRDRAAAARRAWSSAPAAGTADRQRDRRHLPMTSFMLPANCCGEIDSWNSLAMLSSSASAAVGLSAWSHDWAKVLAFAEVS